METRHDRSTGDVTRANWRANCRAAFGSDGLDLPPAQRIVLDIVLGDSAGKKPPATRTSTEQINTGRDRVRIRGDCNENRNSGSCNNPGL